MTEKLRNRGTSLVRVLVASADPELRKLMGSLVGRLANVQVLSLASSWLTLVKKAETFRPDACIVDAELFPDPNGRRPSAIGSVRWLSVGPDRNGFGVDRVLSAPSCATDSNTEATFLNAVASGLGLPGPAVAVAQEQRCPPRNVRVVGIGVSTGGPQALHSVLRELPEDFPVPILVVQHMPPNFTGSLAKSLDAVASVRVREAKSGDKIEPGNVYIAPGGFHMRAEGPVGDARIRITDEAPVMACRPSVNVMFRSLLRVFARDFVAVVMTGMGDDGLDACSEIHKRGGFVIAQDASSCTVYGMPRAVVENGVADEIVELARLSTTLCQMVQA